MSQNPPAVVPKPKTPEPIAPVKPKTPPKQAPIEQPNARPRSPAPQPVTEVKSRPVTPILVQPAKQPNAEESANLNPNQPLAVPTRPVTPNQLGSEDQQVPANVNVPPPVPYPIDLVDNYNTQNDTGEVAVLTDAPKPPVQKEDFDVIFVGDVPPNLECKVCGQVLRVPQKLPCEHLLCLNCTKDLKSCPTCNRAFHSTEIQTDRQTEKLIQKLPVKCSFSDNGCPWQGILKQLKSHAVACQFTDTICPRGCGEVYPKNGEAAHLAECTRKTAPCEHCKKEVSLRGMKSHLKLCPAMVIACPNKCGFEPRSRAEIQQHLIDCPRRGSVCPFAEFGCQYSGGRETIQKHIKEQLVEHLSFVCFGLVEFKDLVSHAYLNLEKMIRNSDVLQGRIDALEKLYGAQYIWRINRYQHRYEEARANVKPLMFSPPFLSGRHGYKLILSAALFGDGPARGHYISIYICLMRGDHDGLLAWPFTHKVTLTIMDQNPNPEERRHLVYAIKPSPTAENALYLQRPTDERNMAFGAQKFCRLAEVPPFVREDVMYVKCNIDTENMIVL
ncbi:Trf-1 [Aphelenchoides bicaudatus]|nr:Trf-1 [Aphelenchoides bicaudatus]